MDISKIALIGFGPWGKNIFTTVSNHLPALKITHVATNNLESIKFLGPSVACSKWQDILENADIEGVITAAPPETNVEVAFSTLKRRLPIFIEKPMGLSRHEAKQIMDLAYQTQGRAIVNHIDLYNHKYQDLKTKILSPITEINAVIGGPSLTRKDMSPLWEYGPHFIAVILDLVSTMPTKIKANVFKESGPKFNYSITFNFSENLKAHLLVGNAFSLKKRFVCVNTQTGIETYDDLENSQLAPINHESPLTSSLKCFHKLLKKDNPYLTDIEMGYKVISLLEDIDRQINEG